LDNLYTDSVKRYIYAAKDRLPRDFSLTTDERELLGSGTHDTIVIVVNPRQFDWRTVEDRLAIVLVLERLKQLIREEGIPCEIEKPNPIPE
jgi:hypothetical protein